MLHLSDLSRTGKSCLFANSSSGTSFSISLVTILSEISQTNYEVYLTSPGVELNDP